MKLMELAGHVPGETRLVGADVEISSVEIDSRQVGPGALFFCIPGSQMDGHDFAPGAVERGAAALVVERVLPLNVPQLLVESAREALAYIAAAFYGNPARGMRLIGRAGFGLEKLSSGGVYKNGKKITDPLTAIRSGIGYVSKDRDTEALILSASIADNITFPSLDAISRFTFINPLKEKSLVKREVERYLIKCNSPRQLVSTLSGGNKQKVSFAKWTAKGSDVIIMDCPTRGVDIGVKQAMYAFIAQMKKEGKAILLISEELPELIGMADKIIILKDFAVSGEFMRSADLKETDIIGSMI